MGESIGTYVGGSCEVSWNWVTYAEGGRSHAAQL
jgi:hypothetical protein